MADTARFRECLFSSFGVLRLRDRRQRKRDTCGDNPPEHPGFLPCLFVRSHDLSTTQSSNANRECANTFLNLD
jgi:hypothetical protein